MIIDLFNNLNIYLKLNPRLEQAFKYLQTNDLSRLPLGRFEIDGDDLYGTINEYETIPRGKALWEAHRRYFDVQLVIRGEEMIGYAPLSSLRVTSEYKYKEDYVLLDGEGSYFTIKPGMFVVFGPGDAHRPGIALEAPNRVKKAVLKVLDPSLSKGI
ncbi:MAG: YhcH/YjgK/YiaL family protein [Candidatus Margulisiibacteriota bacterium]